MASLKPTKQRLSGAAAILANVHVSEDPARLQLQTLPKEVQAKFAIARLAGYRPVCVYWPDGAMAIVPLPNDETCPRPEVLIQAYHAASNCSETFPKGVLK